MYIDFYYECVHFDLWAFHSSVRPNTSVVGIDSGTTGKIPNLILSNRWLVLCFYFYHVKNKNNVYISISLAWEGKILTYRRCQTALCHSNTGSSSVVVSEGFYRFRDIKSNERSENLFDKNHVSSAFFFLKDASLFSKIWLVNLRLLTERLVVANEHKMRNSVGITHQGFFLPILKRFSP